MPTSGAPRPAPTSATPSWGPPRPPAHGPSTVATSSPSASSAWTAGRLARPQDEPAPALGAQSPAAQPPRTDACRREKAPRPSPRGTASHGRRGFWTACAPAIEPAASHPLLSAAAASGSTTFWHKWHNFVPLWPFSAKAAAKATWSANTPRSSMRHAVAAPAGLWTRMPTSERSNRSGCAPPGQSSARTSRRRCGLSPRRKTTSARKLRDMTHEPRGSGSETLRRGDV
jgi:hypothetical protein